MSQADLDGRNQIVAKVNGRDVTRGQLSEAFDRVAHPENWKNPILATIIASKAELAMIREAVVFFTGSVPDICWINQFRGATYRHYLVRAAGYYATIGA